MPVDDDGLATIEEEACATGECWSAAAAAALQETKDAIIAKDIDEALKAVKKVKAEYEKIGKLITDADNADLKFLKEQWESAQELADEKKNEMVDAILNAAKLSEERAKTALENKDQKVANEEVSNSQTLCDEIKKLLEDTDFKFKEVKKFHENAIELAKQTKEKVEADEKAKKAAKEKAEKEKQQAETKAAGEVTSASEAATAAVGQIESTTAQAITAAEQTAATAVSTAADQAQKDAAEEKKNADQAEEDRKKKLAEEQKKIEDEANTRKREREEAEAAAKTAAEAAAATAAQEAEQRRLAVEQAAAAAAADATAAADAEAAAAAAADEAVKTAAAAAAKIARLTHEKAVVVQNLETKSRQLLTKETELGAKILEKTGEFEALKIEKEKVDAKLARLQTEYDEVVKDRGTKTESGIKQTEKIASLEATKTALEAEKASTKLIVDDLKQKLKTATEDLGKETGQHASLKTLKARADGEVARLEGEKSALEGEKTALEAERGALKLERADLTSKLAIERAGKSTAEGKLALEQSSLPGKIAAAEIKGRDDYIASLPTSGGAGGGGGSAGATILISSKFNDLTDKMKKFYNDELNGKDPDKFVMQGTLIGEMLNLQKDLRVEDISSLPPELQNRLEHLRKFIFWPCRTALKLYREIATLRRAPAVASDQYVRNLQAWGQKMQRIAVDQYNTSKKVSEFYGGFYELNAPLAEQNLDIMPPR